MRFGTKILLAALGAVALSTGVGMLIQRAVIQRQGIDLTKNSMRAVLVEAENVRDSIGRLRTDGAFDFKRLQAEHEASNAPLKESKLYRTIPIVAAWNAIEQLAEQENYEFRVTKFSPRNPRNEPTAYEAAILKRFEEGKIWPAGFSC